MVSGASLGHASVNRDGFEGSQRLLAHFWALSSEMSGMDGMGIEVSGQTKRYIYMIITYMYIYDGTYITVYILHIHIL